MLFTYMKMRCLRCAIDAINDYLHGECYTCYLKGAKIKVCVVCFKSIKNSSQLCRDCVYVPTKLVKTSKNVFNAY